MTASRLIHTGNVIVDVVLEVDEVPPPGGDVIATSMSVTAGGGLNVITAAIRDGLPVLFVGRYGAGQYGSVVGSALRDCGADLVNTFPEEQDSGFCIALVDATTERTFVTYPGVEAHLRSSDLVSAGAGATDSVYVTGYSLAHPDNAAALTEWLPTLSSQTLVYFDPSPLIGSLDPNPLSHILGRADIVSANLREAAVLTGAADAESMARTLTGRLRDGAYAVVRDGAHGCWVASSSDDAVHVPGFAVDAVDTNGAGDAHAGVLLAGLSRGLSIHEAASRANAAAALAVTRRGPATSPERAEIDRLVHGALSSADLG